jgi:propionate CoA-transferase
MEEEAGTIEMLSLAQAARNSGGIIIAQVKRIVDDNERNPWLIRIPSIFVDHVVKASPDNHWQTFEEKYNPAFSGKSRLPLKKIKTMSLDERKIISRRGFREIREKSIVNLGIGIPEGVSMIAGEEDAAGLLKLTVEAGAIGGIPAGGLSFGASYNPEAIIDQPYQFDFYDGGGLDIAFLGMAQVDRFGNINVSKFGSFLPGCGGFINISQNTKKVVFCGTFTSGGLEVKIKGGKLNILNEGKHKKFVDEVEHITFSGKYATEREQEILYITERAVFWLKRGKLDLIEIAPGVELQEDILDQMEFKPSISKDIKKMDPEIFE